MSFFVSCVDGCDMKSLDAYSQYVKTFKIDLKASVCEK